MAAEGAILNEMLDIVAKRAALRTFDGAATAAAAAQPLAIETTNNSGSSRSRSNSNVAGGGTNILVGDVGGGRRAFESDVSLWSMVFRVGIVAVVVVLVFACIFWLESF